MSAALYIVAETPPEGFDPFVNGKALSKHNAKLEKAAKKLGVLDLMDFFSQNPEEAAELFDGDLADLPPEKWFDAKEGLATIRALLGDFISNGLDADIVSEHAVLSKLAELNIRWHLAVDY